MIAPYQFRSRLVMFLGFLLFLVVPAARADSFPPAGFTETQSEKSPAETFEIVYFRKEPSEILSGSEIWLKALKPGFTTQLVFTYQDEATCLISPDETFIAINDHVLDGLDEVNVLVRRKGGIYKEDKRSLLETGIVLMAKQFRLKKVPDFDFKHCSADAWLRGGFLLCHLQAHASQTCNLGDWYFVYDVRKDKFLWDLSKVNQDAFQRGPGY